MLNHDRRQPKALLGRLTTAFCNVAFAVTGLLLLSGMPALAQTGTAASPIDTGFRSMYNLQFEQAHRAFAEWQGMHPQDPMGPVAGAAVFLFAECDRLHILEMQFLPDDKKARKSSELTPDPEVKRQFDAMLEQGRLLAEARLAEDPHDKNALFARLLLESLHGDYLALVANRERDALGHFKQSRVLAESLIAIDPANYDAYLPIGVENYLTSLKGGFTRWILRAGGAQTDKATGLNNLKIVAEKGHYLAPFARVFLAIAALHDHDKAGATELMEHLAHEFPENNFYAHQLAQLRAEAGLGGGQ
jgi:hypothetical protein